VLIAVAVPSTGHYLRRTWTDHRRPYAQITRTELPIVALLRKSDPERTVVLHNRPRRSTLVRILAERRSLLAWSNYARGSDQRRMDVEAFFASASGSAAQASDVLQRYRPTHVLEYRKVDRIHPEVRARLQLLFQNADVALYAARASPCTRSGPRLTRHLPRRQSASRKRCDTKELRSIRTGLNDDRLRRAGPWVCCWGRTQPMVTARLSEARAVARGDEMAEVARMD